MKKWEEIAIEEISNTLIDLAKAKFRKPSELRERLLAIEALLRACFKE